MAAKSSASTSTGGSVDCHVVSPSLLKMFETQKSGYKPRPKFLLGLGEPFEPNPWDLDCTEDHTMLQAAEEQLSKLSTSTSRWASPKSTIRLQQIREGGVPRNTKSRLVSFCLGSVDLLPCNKSYQGWRATVWNTFIESKSSKLPVLNLGVATNFTFNFNLGKDPWSWTLDITFELFFFSCFLMYILCTIVNVHDESSKEN